MERLKGYQWSELLIEFGLIVNFSEGVPSSPTVGATTCTPWVQELALKMLSYIGKEIVK